MLGYNMAEHTYAKDLSIKQLRFKDNKAEIV